MYRQFKLKTFKNSLTFLSKRSYALIPCEADKWIKPPIMETHDGFYIDNRRGQREVLDVKWEPKIPLKGPIRFEIADMEDNHLFSQFNTDIFHRNCEFVQQADANFDTTLPMFYLHSKQMLPDRVSFLVFDDDKLIGLSANCIFKKEEWDAVFPYGYGQDNPKLEMLPDYADHIATYDVGSRPSNVMCAFLDESMARSGSFFPKDMRGLATTDCAAVHDAYRNTGLGFKVLDFALELLKNRGSDCVFGHCVANETAFICTQRLGYKSLVNVPYDCFLENGKQVFNPAPSGKTGDLVVLKRI